MTNTFISVYFCENSSSPYLHIFYFQESCESESDKNNRGSAGEEAILIGDRDSKYEEEQEQGTSEMYRSMDYTKHGYLTTSTPCSELGLRLLIYQRGGGFLALMPCILVSSLTFLNPLGLFLLVLLLLAMFPIDLILWMNRFFLIDLVFPLTIVLFLIISLVLLVIGLPPPIGWISLIIGLL